jgi:hypothetical protein
MLIDRFVKTKSDSTELAHLLSMPTLSKKRNGKPRKYKDLLIGRFRLTNVVRIERQDDPNTVSRKWADYSLTSLQILYEQGRKDTLNRIISNEFKKDLDSLKLEREVKEELESLLDELMQTLGVNSTDLLANLRGKLSGLKERVIFLNRNGKINDSQAEQISRRAESLKSSLED